jgi:hypothetical protein
MKSETVRALSYIYFLRFSLFLWVLPIALLALDASMTRIFTRGIFLPEFCAQYLCNAFFLSSTGMVALVTSRLVIFNGEDRFGIMPPEMLDYFLGDAGCQASWKPLLVCQTPALSALVWIACLATAQEVRWSWVLSGMTIGYLLSFVFWLVINALYLWSYNPKRYAPLNNGALQLPRVVLFSSSWLGFKTLAAHGGPGSCDLIQRSFGRFFDFLAQLGPGYSSQKPLPDGQKRWPLWEGQCFALVGFVCLVFVYLLLFPLTAPLRLTVYSTVALMIATLVAFLTILIVVSGGDNENRSVLLFRIVTTSLIVIFMASIWLLYFLKDPERFPVLSSVLVLLTLLIWAGSAVAFFLDRFRVPVASVVLVYFLLGNVVYKVGTSVARKLQLEIPFYDHYFPVTTASGPVELPGPADILKAKRQSYPNDPLIVITATGGGLHAAGWTATILGELEKASLQVGDYNWHDHILLLSTVSGGSVGAYSYLRELSLDNNFEKHHDLSAARMTDLSMCSSLEAVGWGLTYVDAVQALTGLPLLRSDDPEPAGATGDTSFKPRLLGDRSWALGAAFARNLRDYDYCMLDDPRYRVLALSAARVTDAPKGLIAPEELTLRDTIPQGQNSIYPAFTMNTTAVESGERFLLANYKIPDDNTEIQRGMFVHAESFLNVYGELNGKNPNSHIFADLPLSSAARLSATFPYVSSVSRIPPSYTTYSQAKDGKHFNPGFHFADGGYYDNDGVASAIEFLCYAFADGRCDPPKQALPTQPAGQTTVTSQAVPAKHAATARETNAFGMIPDSIGKEPQNQKPYILFIEIRDSCDVTEEDPNDLASQQRNSKALFNAIDQLGAPVHAFWLAGHDSITLRNRRELQVAESALGLGGGRLNHIVIPYCDRQNGKESGSNYALSWSLTPLQREEIQRAAERRTPNLQQSSTSNHESYGAGDLIDSAMNWIKAMRTKATFEAAAAKPGRPESPPRP